MGSRARFQGEGEAAGGFTDPGPMPPSEASCPVDASPDRPASPVEKGLDPPWTNLYTLECSLQCGTLATRGQEGKLGERNFNAAHRFIWVMLGTGVRMQLTMIGLDRQVRHYEGYRTQDPEAWEAFEERLDLSWLHHDFAMEGVSLREADTRAALGHGLTRHHSEAQQHEKIRALWDAIAATRQRVAAGQGPLELEDIKTFHVELTGESDPRAGRYRKGQGPPSAYQHSVTRPPSISYRLRKLVDAMRGPYADLHPVQAAAHVHFDFMTTWPFDERSGTAGRLLMNWWLLRSGYPPAIFHATDRQAYYSALCAGPIPMTNLVVDALTTTMRSADAFFAERAPQSLLGGVASSAFGLLG